jgi:hypothetical protein
MLLPASQVQLLECLALDPTEKPQSREYIIKHNLARGGSLQGALTGLQQKGLIYGSKQGYRLALPLLALWIRQRLSLSATMLILFTLIKPMLLFSNSSTTIGQSLYQIRTSSNAS